MGWSGAESDPGGVGCGRRVPPIEVEGDLKTKGRGSWMGPRTGPKVGGGECSDPGGGALPLL